MSGEIKQVKRLVGTEFVNENRYFIDGKEVTKKEFDKAFPVQEGIPGGHSPACWPMTSEALAVHPKQVKEANERAARNGIDATYDEGGFCKLGSRNARKKLLKLEGFADKRGGYGD